MRVKHQHSIPPEAASTAPYNFVSFPQHWLLAGEDQQSAGHDRFAPGCLSGYLKLELEALTPVYVRGSQTLEERGQGEEWTQPEFFQPAGRARIPGSTLRGMVRSLVEIVSHSPLRDVTDGPLFYRTMDGSSLSTYYNQQLGNNRSDIHAGYLIRHEGGVALRPARTLEIEGQPPGTFIKVDEDFVRRQCPGLQLPRLDKEAEYHWGRYPVRFNLFTPQLEEVKAGESTAEYDPNTGWVTGVLIASGTVPKKRHHWLVAPPNRDAEPIPVPYEFLRLYRQRSGGMTEMVEGGHRNGSFPVLPTEEHPEIPCFYRRWTNGDGPVEIAFGHTRMFRLPYKNYEPQALIDGLIGEIAGPGLAEVIFGVSAEKEGCAGHVWFGDALLTGSKAEWQEGEPTSPHILASPKPTSFPHYLCQDDVRTRWDKRRNRNTVDTRQLRHWDRPEATPRGVKLYWHRSGTDWTEGEVREGTQYTQIQVVRAGAKFAGRVRFDNLTPAQLGALLLALQLPPTWAHKLGMGKPLGLGSLRITCQLHLIDRNVRYKELFAEAEEGHRWTDGERKATNAEVEAYRKAFALWVLRGLNCAKPERPEEALWALPRMQELAAMLDFSGKPADTATEYLKGPNPDGATEAEKKGEFGERRVLPGALQVYGAGSPRQQEGTASGSQASLQSQPAQLSARTETWEGCHLRFDAGKVTLVATQGTRKALVTGARAQELVGSRGDKTKTRLRRGVRGNATVEVQGNMRTIVGIEVIEGG
jgi:CRISPR-associated protein (TIGR03986 family)